MQAPYAKHPLDWEIGRRIGQDILRQKRAEYGEQIVYALSRQLTVHCEM